MTSAVLTRWQTDQQWVARQRWVEAAVSLQAGETLDTSQRHGSQSHSHNRQVAPCQPLESSLQPPDCPTHQTWHSITNMLHTCLTTSGICTKLLLTSPSSYWPSLSSPFTSPLSSPHPFCLLSFSMSTSLPFLSPSSIIQQEYLGNVNNSITERQHILYVLCCISFIIWCFLHCDDWI